MPKRIMTIKVEVNDDKEAYFIINKLNTIHWLENVKIKEANYRGKTTSFNTGKGRRNWLKSKTTKD